MRSRSKEKSRRSDAAWQGCPSTLGSAVSFSLPLMNTHCRKCSRSRRCWKVRILVNVPSDKQQAADEAHRKFYNRDSDFLTILNLWDAWHDKQKTSSHGQVRKWCQQNFLSYMRMREWVDVHAQLKDLLSESDDPAIAKAARALNEHRKGSARTVSSICRQIEVRKQRQWKIATCREIRQGAGIPIRDGSGYG